MTATDELRAMLDERGVEHYDGTERTLWGYEQTGEDTGIYRFAANEISGGFLQFDMFRITPAQAIAATLGAGTCRSTTDDSAWCFVCSECGKSFPRSDLHFAHNHGEINYCPNCGRRVIE